MVLLLTGTPLFSHTTTASPDDEQLVDAHTFRFAFLQTGFFATTAGLVVYFLVSTHYTFTVCSMCTTYSSQKVSHYMLQAACIVSTVSMQRSVDVLCAVRQLVDIS
jgi:hypothetical protein